MSEVCQTFQKQFFQGRGNHGPVIVVNCISKIGQAVSVKHVSHIQESSPGSSVLARPFFFFINYGDDGSYPGNLGWFHSGAI